jgi:hypothetical protein
MPEIWESFFGFIGFITETPAANLQVEKYNIAPNWVDTGVRPRGAGASFAGSRKSFRREYIVSYVITTL